MSNKNYLQKYLKYKNKYLELQKFALNHGGVHMATKTSNFVLVLGKLDKVVYEKMKTYDKNLIFVVLSEETESSINEIFEEETDVKERILLLNITNVAKQLTYLEIVLLILSNAESLLFDRLLGQTTFATDVNSAQHFSFLSNPRIFKTETTTIQRPNEVPENLKISKVHDVPSINGVILNCTDDDDIIAYAIQIIYGVNVRIDIITNELCDKTKFGETLKRIINNTIKPFFETYDERNERNIRQGNILVKKYVQDVVTRALDKTQNNPPRELTQLHNAMRSLIYLCNNLNDKKTIKKKIKEIRKEKMN